MKHLFSLLLLSATAVRGDVNSIYEGCGDTKQCQGYFFSSCVDTRDCDLIVTWRSESSDVVEFEVQATGSGFADGQHYVAVGFSRNNEMGDDTAVITSEVFQGDLTALYWNEDHLETRLVGDNSGVEFRELISEAEETEYLYARFARQVRLEFVAPSGVPPEPVDEVNDLSLESFFLLCSSGPVDQDTLLPQQHERAGSTVDAINFV